MKFDSTPARKMARKIIEEAKRQVRRNNNGEHPVKNDVQVQVQLILNAIKKELKDNRFQVF